MKLFKRIITSFLVVVTCVSLCLTTVFAAWYNDLAYNYTQSDFAQWAAKGVCSWVGNKAGAAIGTVVIPGIGSVSGSVIGTGVGLLASDGFNAFMNYLAQDSSFVSESDYIDSLHLLNDSYSPSYSIPDDVVEIYFPSVWRYSDVFVTRTPIFSGFDMCYGTGSVSGWYKPGTGGFSSPDTLKNPNLDYTCNLLLPAGRYRISLDGSYFSTSSTEPTLGLLPVSVGYNFVSASANVVICHSDGSFLSSFYLTNSSPTATFILSQSERISLSIGNSGGSGYPDTYYYSQLACHVERLASEGDDSMYGSWTRPASFMNIINNYNNENRFIDNPETVNYFIGLLNSDGEVVDLYSPDIFNEDTCIFTEPITGTQFVVSHWDYSYRDRLFTLNISPGTLNLSGYDISDIYISYGDDSLTIYYWSDDAGFVREDEYAYVCVTQSECALNGHTYTYETVQEPTCTTSGERKYTCSVCGNEYAEEIPKTDHSYTVSVEQEATCTANGIELYTCSVCGDQHTEPIAALGHDWLAAEVTDTAYNLPPGASCPDCGGTDFTHELDKNGGVFGCACSACGKEWMEQAEITYGHTAYTCSRCGETYIESEDPESGLFASIGSFIANGIGWVTDKLSDLINSISGINDIFSGFVERIREKAGDYPAFLGAVIACLPKDLTLVFWFAVVAAVVLAVWKKWFH